MPVEHKGGDGMLSDKNFMELFMAQEKKDRRPRVRKEYKLAGEYYPWHVVVFPAVFPTIGLFVFMKSAADFSKNFKFGGIFYLILGLIFVGAGAFFYFGYPCANETGTWKRFCELVKTAQNRGKPYKGEITGYKILPVKYMGGRSSMPEVTLNYVLEVKFLEDTAYKTIEIPGFRYHPNSVLKGKQCKVYVYEGKYYLGKFELRTGRKDETAEIPQKGMY